MDLNIDNILKQIDANAVGEFLRAITFVNDGSEFSYGCYSSFDTIPEATQLSREDRVTFWLSQPPAPKWLYMNPEPIEKEDAEEQADQGEGCVYNINNYRIEMCYYWYGDGTLSFRVYKGMETIAHIQNTDCKKAHEWEDLTLASVSDKV
jgi:hypothetical protein